MRLIDFGKSYEDQKPGDRIHDVFSTWIDDKFCLVMMEKAGKETICVRRLEMSKEQAKEFTKGCLETYRSKKTGE